MSLSTITTPNVVIQDAPAKIVSVETYPQLDLEEKSLDAPVYKYTKLTQVSGGTTQSLSTSTTLSTFNIPGGVAINLARSFLIFDLIVAAPTAAGYNVVQCDSIPLDYIQFVSQSGDLIGEVRNAQQFTKVVRPAHETIDEFNSRGPVPPGATVAAGGYATNHYLQPASWLTTPTIADSKLDVIAADLSTTEMNNQYMTDVAAGTTSVSLNWVSCSMVNQSVTLGEFNPLRMGVNYQASGVDRDGAQQALICQAQNGATIVHCKIPLKAFSGSIMALDKELYFGQNMQLKLNWQPLANWGFQTSSLTATQATATAFLAGAGATATQLSNYYLWLCKDTNPKNIENLMRQNQTTGVELLVPWNDSNSRPAGAAATSYTHSTLISPGSGLSVKRIYSTLINGNNTLTTVASANNVGQVKYTNLQSSIDSRFIQDAPLDETQDEVYNYMYPLIKGSPSGMSSRIWHIRNFYCDNFSDCDSLTKANENDAYYSGLSIGPVYRQYDVKYTLTSNAVGLICYQWVIYLKKLRITPLAVRYV